jgi:serine/threonine protein kinase
MDGGALLGEGTYGCVFSPPLLCSRKPKYQVKKGDVGKITEAIDVVNEITAANILDDVKGDYFILPNTKSVCRPSDITKQPDIQGLKNCEFINKVHMKDVIHYTMPYGGITIRNLLMNLSKSPIQLIPFTRHLLEGGTQLALHGYVHYDIHQNNILISPKSGQPNLIDFGMSFSANNITTSVLDERWKVYSPDYSPEPPEVTCITAIRKNIPLNNILNDMIKKRTALKDVEVLLGVSRQVQIKKFLKFWNSSKAIKEQNWVSFFKHYWTGFDAWSIGVTLLTVIRMIYILDPKAASMPGIGQVKELCKNLLSMDPRERFDCIEALAFIDPDNTIINSPAGIEWKKEKDSIRAKMKDL